MAFTLNSNFAIGAPKPIDERYLSTRIDVGGSNGQLPYSADTEVYSALFSSRRYTGLTVNINGEEWWFANSIADGTLVKKGTGGGTVTGATNGVYLTGKVVKLGGNLGGDAVFSGGTLTYLIHPTFTGDTQIVDKKYVDTVALGLSPKLAVEIATTGNITLSTNQSIDGVFTTDGMRVLVKDQLIGSENGIYSANTGSWGRVADFNASGETVQGSLIPVISGNTSKNSIWVLVTDNPIIPNTTPMVFGLFSSPIFIAGTGIDIVGSTISLTTPVQNILNVALTGTTGSFIGTSGRNVCIDSAAQTILNNAITNAGSGLHKAGQCVSLGGTLTGDTFIETSASCLVLGTAGKQIKIDSSAIVIGEITQVSNFIYTSPLETIIDSGAGNLIICSTDIVVSGTSFCYETHPTFTQPTQIVDKKYVDDRASGSTTYQCASPSTCTVGGLPAGSSLTGCGLDRILEQILTPYIAPSFSSFSNSGVPSTVEVGCVISGTKLFTWGFSNGNVQPATMCVRSCNITVGSGNTLALNISTSSPQTVTINTTTFTSYGQQQSWCGSAKNTNLSQFGSGSYITTALLPYYWGLCTCPGPSGANRPIASCAMVLTGTKVLAGTAGSFSISFNSTGNDYLWFAVPTVAGADKTTWFINPSNCGLIGGGIGAGCNLFPVPDPVSVTALNGCWSSCPYKVYISNKQAIASGAMLIG